MNLATTPDGADVQHTEVQLTLSWADAERLRVTVPWLLRALADRPTAQPRMRERRRKAYTALESLLNALSAQPRPAEHSHETQ
jgi:hypothetical protein